MLRRESQRIQHWRLRSNEIITAFCCIYLLLFTPNAHAQSSKYAAFNQAEIAYHTAKWSEALKLYLQIESDTSQIEKAFVWFRISQCYQQYSKPQDALNFAQKAYLSDTNNTAYALQLAEIYDQQFRYQESWPLRYQLVIKEPRFISRYIDAIQNARNREDYLRCIQLSEQWITQFGLGEFITEVLAWAYIQNQQPEKVLPLFDSLIVKYPLRGEFPIKREEWKHLLNQEPSNPAAPNHSNAIEWAIQTLNAGKAKEAQPVFEELLNQEPDNLLASEYAFLSAYIVNDSASLFRLLEYWYMIFPFLEEPQQSAEIILDCMKNPNQKSLDTLKNAKIRPVWEYIRLHILTQHQELEWVKNRLSKLEHEAAEPLEPLFYIQQLNLQPLTK